MEQQTKSFLNRGKSFFNECKRVLKVTRKPTPDEFKTIVKVTGVGMLAIGFVGFVIVMIGHYVKLL